MERAPRRRLAFAATVAASLLAAVFLVVLSGWGADDLYPFLFWTLPFAAIVALATRRVARLVSGKRGGAAIAASVGAVAGILWSIVVAMLLGPFVLAFGFPIWLAWAVGGAAGFVAGAALQAPRSVRAVRRLSYGTLAAVVVAIVVPPIAVALFDPGADIVAELRAGTPDARAHAFVWNVVMEQSGVESVTQNDPLVLEIEFDDHATDEERARLRSVLERSPLVERIDD
jgi:hypothetical protein